LRHIVSRIDLPVKLFKNLLGSPCTPSVPQILRRDLAFTIREDSVDLALRVGDGFLCGLGLAIRCL
jgi:hypothetical protein